MNDGEDSPSDSAAEPPPLPDLAEIVRRCSQLQGVAQERELERMCDSHPELLDRARRMVAKRPSAAVPAAEDIAEGVTIGPFIFRKKLGSGSYGSVWHVYNNVLRCHSALKVFHGSVADEVADAVHDELRRARRVYSENIAPAYGTARLDNGRLCIDMQLCADPDPASEGPAVGGSLAEDKRARSSLIEAVRLVEVVARTVDGAHRSGVVHGDIKPENIVVTPHRRRPFVVDFGLTSCLGGGAQGIGTPGYMPPEQKRGATPTQRSDVYMLGGTLFNLLTGKRPGDVGDQKRTLKQADVPGILSDIILKALAVVPSERHDSAEQFADDLRAFTSHNPATVVKSGVLRTWLRFRRNQRLVAAASFAFVFAGVLVAGIAALLLSSETARATLERARENVLIVRKLEAREAEYRSELAEERHAGREAMAKWAATQRALDEARKQEENIAGARDRAQRNLTTVQDELGTTRTELAATKTSLATTKDDLATRDRELGAAKTTLAKAQAELTKTQGELTTAKAEVMAKSQEIDALKAVQPPSAPADDAGDASSSEVVVSAQAPAPTTGP